MKPVSEEGFRRYLRPYIDQGIPFLAYWHPGGVGLIRLDEVQVPVKPPIELHQLEANVPTRAKVLGKRGRKAWKKNLDALRREGRPMLAVAFDGARIKIEGGKLDL